MFDKQQGIHCVLSIEHKQADREVVRSQIIQGNSGKGFKFYSKCDEKIWGIRGKMMRSPESKKGHSVFSTKNKL